jgi:hypothetical protein
VANQQPTKRPEPGDGPLDNPAVSIRAEAATILVTPMVVVTTIGTGQDDASAGEALAERVTVVAAVRDQVLGQPPVRSDACVQRRVNERDFRGGRRSNGDSQRKTLTLDQYHAL